MKKKISLFWNKLKSNIFYRNIGIVASGNVTAKLIAILLTPVITRIYTPADYGVYNIFMSIIGITGSLGTLRYAITIPIAKNEKRADNLLRLCFLITFCLSFLWLLIIALSEDKIANYYKSEQIKQFLWLIPIVSLGQGIYEALSNWAVRNRNFKLITKTKVSQSVSSSFVKIGLGLLNIKPMGLFIGHVVQEATGIFSLFSALSKKKPGFFKEISFTGIKSAAIRYKRFPLIQSWSQLLLSAGSQLPVLLLGVFYGVEVVGVFGLANAMIRMPVDLIGQAVSQVYFGEISKYGKDNPEKIYNLTKSIIKKLFIIAVIPIALIALLGPWIFSLVFGIEWYDAGLFARLLSVYILAAFISGPVSSVFNVYERMDLQFKLNLLRVFLNATIFLACGYLKISSIATIGVFSIVMSLYFIFMTIRIVDLIKAYMSDKYTN